MWRWRDLSDDDGTIGGDPGLVNDGQILLGREGVPGVCGVRGMRMSEVSITGSELGTSGATRV